ncbi:MAG: hypothetical protein ABW061_11025 [Polyangiaceae bacterium]
MSNARTRLHDFLPDASELALLFAARGLACVAAWQAGFRALSDDDYARIAIAQRFAHAPSFDPTGTSWLPAPFWIYGALFRCFGTDLSVARATAIAGALAATVLVYVAARLLGAAPFSALLGAAFSALLAPYSAILGIAAVPEVPCAGLMLFAVATLAHREPRLRALGGLALSAACLSRYEAWPLALVFALYCCWDAGRERQAALLGCAALALAGLGCWLALGQQKHGDAWFFVTRVTSYRRALGGQQVSVLRRLLEYPRLALWEGLLLWPLLLIPAFMTNKAQRQAPLAVARALVTLSALLAFLMLGSVRDGVPTHHAARVLLPLWFFASIVAGHLIGRLAHTRSAWARAVFLAAVALTAFQRGAFASAEGFAQRQLELEAGQVARRHTDRGLAIDTPDYGFFAVQAGFGAPQETSVFDDHDPRHPKASPFLNAARAERALREHEARFAIVSDAHAALLQPRCAELWKNRDFTLLSCPSSRD